MSKVTVADGVERETLAGGEQLMIVRFTFEKDAGVPWHAHIHEQSSYIVAGKLKLFVEDEEILLTPGMSAIVPANARHRAVALAGTVDVNAFTPVREDYL
ncbi:MAG: cupin domain-containing protein [Thermacetogeniaceae bacterium]